MGKLRSLSGKDLLDIFSVFGFQSVSQHGSQVKLRRTLSTEYARRGSCQHN
jgi:predicted RNA binding protein YcfA (HicA-like mRNA interferase family)